MPKAWDLASLAVGTLCHQLAHMLKFLDTLIKFYYYYFAVGTNQAQAVISNYGRRLYSRL